MGKSKENFKEEMLIKINMSNYDYSDAMKYLLSRERSILKGWDSIVEKDGKYFYFDHARKHRSDEEYGNELTGEVLDEYRAVKELIHDFQSERIRPIIPVWGYYDAK